MEEQGEIAPDGTKSANPDLANSGQTEFVDGPEESREDASHPADDGRQAETPGEQEVRANFGAGTEAQRKEAKRRIDLDDSGKDIKGNLRKPSRSSQAAKRRIEDEDGASLEKASKAAR